METTIASSGQEKLAKSFKDAGNSTFAIGIFMIIQILLIPAINSLNSKPLFDLGTIAMMFLTAVFAVYLILAGSKMKKDTFSNVNESYKTALILMLLSIVIFFIFSPTGSIFVLFYLFLMINDIRAFLHIKNYKKLHTAS